MYFQIPKYRLSSLAFKPALSDLLLSWCMEEMRACCTLQHWESLRLQISVSGCTQTLPKISGYYTFIYCFNSHSSSAEAQQKNSVGKMESIQLLLFMCPTFNIAKFISEYLMWRNTTKNRISKALDYFLSNQHVLTLLSRQLADLTKNLPCQAISQFSDYSGAEPYRELVCKNWQWSHRFSVCDHGWGGYSTQLSLRGTEEQPLQASFYSWWLKLAS